MGIGIIFIVSLICHSLAKEVILNLNDKRPIFTTSEKFLSFTLDPMSIFSDDLKSNFLSSNLEKCINIAKAFSPAYVRFAGPECNSFHFENKEFPQDSKNITKHNFTENILNLINQWAKKSGLNLITCIGQEFIENSDDSSQLWNAIAFTDQMGYNTSWQLGYEFQSRCNFRGENLGQEIKHLRRVLNAFPRYSTSLIVGPDVTEFKTENQEEFLLDYFHSAGSALSLVTWHPNFNEVSLNNNEVVIREENLSTEKENLEKTFGQSILEKPLWIAESKDEKCKNQFIGALVWTRRLGNAAKVGAQVLMRQPDNSNLFKPSPDFWVSLLHKTLVGPEVFNLNIQSGNETRINFFCQCTKRSSKYKRGSLTIFGINFTPNKIVANLKGLKIKETDDYILLPGFDSSNQMFAETVLLNNKPLALKNENEIPDIEPIKRRNEKGVPLILPSGGIGFWVIPNLKLKACRKNVNKQKVKTLTRLLQSDEKKDLATEELNDLSSELKKFFLKDNKGQTDFSISEEKQINQEKETKRLRRNAENMNNLLNREMFLQAENNQQYRTIRRAKNSAMKQELEVDPERAVIIGSDEDISSEEEIPIEDGSGAHGIVPTPETTQFIKVKREFKNTENNPRVYSKTTERSPVGPRPEFINEPKSSTEKMITTRDTKKFSPNAKQFQNFSSTSTPSRKRVRNVFATMGLEPKLNIKNQNPIPALKLPQIIPPPMITNADQLKQRVAEARLKLRSIFQDLTNPLKLLRPFPVKREISGQSPLEKFKIFQKSQETRNAEIIQNFGQVVENLKKLQASRTPKNMANNAKLKEFVARGEEQLNKLRNNLRARHDEFVENYKSKSMNFFKKPNNEKQYDFTSVKDFMNRINTAKISNIFSNLPQKPKREIILPKLLNLIKLERIQRIPGNEAGEIVSKLLNLAKGNIDDEDSSEEEEEASNEEVEFLRTLSKLFLNHIKNYPLLLLGSDDPSELYPTVRESANILDEEADYDEGNCNDDVSSEEDENWQYKDNKNKYRRFSRSAYKLNEINKSPINEEKYSRKRRDAEEESSSTTNSKSSKSEKRRKSKKKKNKDKSPEYDSFYNPDCADCSKNQNYWNYPTTFFNYPPHGISQHPDELPTNYNFHYDHQNPISYYSTLPLYPHRRRRRQLDSNIIKTDKTNEKITIPIEKVVNKQTNEENADFDFLTKVENCLESTVNCPNDLTTETMNENNKFVMERIDDFTTEKIIDNNFATENPQIHSEKNENLLSVENNAATTDSAIQNNLESLMSIEKIYDKSLPSTTEHRIYSRKMLSDNEKNVDTTLFQDVTKTIENIFTYFSNITESE
ncbi:uncharacterized protein LOC122509586 [Leptopilina heterotoma]|uniref:uncharacterized protein LOC122509586 n=1 Tax=Leptopilina heterotoma TaxID=63436 RepID=UPI001CA8A7A8|nr:uncharacterized protein LOC122509586 [Leptopilina heterotoma]